MEKLMTTECEPTVVRLIELLKFGKENAITRTDLAAKLDVRDREVRRAVASARKGYNVPVVNSGTGYYLALSAAEIKAASRAEWARAMACIDSVNAFGNMLNGIEEMQGKLLEGEEPVLDMPGDEILVEIAKREAEYGAA